MGQIIKTIKYRGCLIEIYHDDEDIPEFFWDRLRENKDVFLVNYHRDFEIENALITKEEVIKWYNGEKIPQTENYWFFMLEMLSHGGIWLQLGTNGFITDPGGWDTSHVGVVLVGKKKAKTEEKAKKLAENLIKNYNDLLSGNIYGYTIKDGKIEINNINGFLGNKESDIIKDAKRNIDLYIKNNQKQAREEQRQRDITSTTLGTLLSTNNEIIKRNAISILKQLQKIT